MNAPETLAFAQKIGLVLFLDATGNPRLRGAAKLTKELLDELKANRSEIIALLRPKMPRRIVLLNNGGDVDKVIEECEGAGLHERIREHAKRYPGRTLAAEWWKRDHTGEKWVRFLTILPRLVADESVVPSQSETQGTP